MKSLFNQYHGSHLGLAIEFILNILLRCKFIFITEIFQKGRTTSLYQYNIKKDIYTFSGGHLENKWTYILMKFTLTNEMNFYASKPCQMTF